MASDSLVFYQSWLEQARNLSDPKDAVFQLIEYGIEGKDFHPDDQLTAMFLNMAKPNIDANEKKKRGGAPKGNRNAIGNKGGGAPKGNQNASKKSNSKNKHNLSDVNVNVNVNGTEDIYGGDTSPLGAGDGLAGEDLDRKLAEINAEVEDDE